MPEEDCREFIVSEDVVDFFVQFNGDVEQLVEETGADCFQIIDDRYAIVYYRLPDINIIQTYRTNFSTIPKLYGLVDAAAVEASGVGRIRRQNELGLFGQGTLVGFIDTGIDFANPVFLNADGTTRIVTIWDQSVQSGELPAGYGYGSEFTSEDINLALQSENPLEVVNTVDTDGHGTFLAGVAAGNVDLSEEFSGYAPFAGIVMVKLKPAKEYLKRYFCVGSDIQCYQENDIAMGIHYLLDVARRENKPMCICIGLGSNQQSHDGNGLLDQMIDSLSLRYGLCAVTASGNEGNAAAHFRGGVTAGGIRYRETITSPSIQENLAYDDMEIRVAENEAGFTLSIWGDAPGIFSVAVLSPSGEYTSRLPARVNFNTVINFTFENTILYVSYEIVEQRSGDQLILLRFENPSEGIWTVRVFFDSVFPTTFDAWLPLRPLIAEGTYFLSPNPEITISSPGNNRQAMTAAGYDYRTGGIYIESGRGYTRDARIKPDFAAPAVGIKGPTPGGGYTTRSGTSIAAAETTGACALMMEYAIIRGRRLYLNGVELKKIFIKGAVREGSDFPNREYGWGRLEVFEALASLRGI